jgi:deferrochelatase/peroxidase EfeB
MNRGVGMTSQSGESGERRWLVEPPGPQEVNFQIAAGNQVEVTAAVQEAFTHLIQTLRGDDMQGYIYDPKCKERAFGCTQNGKCTSEYQSPNCLIDYGCKIASFG